MGNYLVTGAAGFIGSAIAKKLVEENITLLQLIIFLQDLREMFLKKLKL